MTATAQRSTLRLSIGAAALTLCAASLHAAENHFLPHGVNNWNVPGHWSLGHCPWPNDTVHIKATANQNKAVSYNWTGDSNFEWVYVDGNGAFYGELQQPFNTLATNRLAMTRWGDSNYYLYQSAKLEVGEYLYVGYQQNQYNAYFEMSTFPNWSAGLYVGDLCYVGYHAPGKFVHLNGFADVGRLYVGQNDLGIYELKGSTSNSILQINSQFVLGNGDVGVFEQTGGTVNQIGMNGLLMGLNSGGKGTYNMRGGELNIYSISQAWSGDACFNLTGGVVNVASNINLGSQGDNPNRASMTLDDTDGEPTLNIGGDLRIGSHSPGKFEQLGQSTVLVAGKIEIWEGSPDPDASSYLFMGQNAGWLSAPALINHSGHLDQEGGILSVTNFTNSSEKGVKIDWNADCRARWLTHDAGTFHLNRNAILRGTHAFGDNFWACTFTNNATFQMGTAVVNGGDFRGQLTNNGTFIYYQGDFSASRLINEGTVNLHNDFESHRIVNNAPDMILPNDLTISVSGSGYANAFENNGGLTMRYRSTVEVDAGTLFVNNGEMRAGGQGPNYAEIRGSMLNNGWLHPCWQGSPAGQLRISGDFSATEDAELRIRLNGTSWAQYNHLIIEGDAELGGMLSVDLVGSYMPALGDSYEIVNYASLSGAFDSLSLPALGSGLGWEVAYDAHGVVLTVVDQGSDCVGDITGDGKTGHADLALLLGAYGSAPGDPNWNPAADLNGDGIINHPDLGILLSDYGCGY